MREARFEAGRDGVRDKTERPKNINDLIDLVNWCGMRYKPSDPEYWDLMEEKLRKWPTGDRSQLVQSKDLSTIDNSDTIVKLFEHLKKPAITAQGKRVNKFSDGL